MNILDLFDTDNEAVGYADVLFTAAAMTQVVGPDFYRQSLILPADSATNIRYCMNDPTTNRGFWVIPNNGPLVLSRLLHGGLVSAAWYGQFQSGSNTLRVMWSSSPRIRQTIGSIKQVKG